MLSGNIKVVKDNNGQVSRNSETDFNGSQADGLDGESGRLCGSAEGGLGVVAQDLDTVSGASGGGVPRGVDLTGLQASVGEAGRFGSVFSGVGVDTYPQDPHVISFSAGLVSELCDGVDVETDVQRFEVGKWDVVTDSRGNCKERVWLQKGGEFAVFDPGFAYGFLEPRTSSGYVTVLSRATGDVGCFVYRLGMADILPVAGYGWYGVKLPAAQLRYLTFSVTRQTVASFWFKYEREFHKVSASLGGLPSKYATPDIRFSHGFDKPAVGRYDFSGLLAHVAWFGYHPHALNLTVRTFAAGNLRVSLLDLLEFTVHVTVPSGDSQCWFLCEGSQGDVDPPVASIAAIVKGVQAVSQVSLFETPRAAL